MAVKFLLLFALQVSVSLAIKALCTPITGGPIIHYWLPFPLANQHHMAISFQMCIWADWAHCIWIWRVQLFNLDFVWTGTADMKGKGSVWEYLEAQAWLGFLYSFTFTSGDAHIYDLLESVVDVFHLSCAAAYAGSQSMSGWLYVASGQSLHFLKIKLSSAKIFLNERTAFPLCKISVQVMENREKPYSLFLWFG